MVRLPVTLRRDRDGRYPKADGLERANCRRAHSDECHRSTRNLRRRTFTK